MMPRRFNWDSIEEQIWDLFLDDDGRRNRYELLTNRYDKIGMACNCNTEFGEVCIVELASELEPYQDNYYYLGYYYDSDYNKAELFDQVGYNFFEGRKYTTSID